MQNLMIDKLKAIEESATEPNMVDMVFELDGVVVPDNYPFALWSEICRCLPWLEKVKGVGVIPLRGSESGNSLLLSKRTKLILRVPNLLMEKLVELSGQHLRIGEAKLTVGKGKKRLIQPTTTLHAHIVESNLNEVEFIADMKQKLDLMNIKCNLICDKRRVISSSDKVLNGFGLVLHDLKPAASIQIQNEGLGGARHYGCGIFIPFKAISGLD